MTGGGGSASEGDVRLLTDVDALAHDMVEHASVVVGDELGGAVKDVFVDAVQNWPVQSGFSRSRLRFSSEGSGFEGRWRITDDAWYARLIKQAGQAPTRVVERLITGPLSEATSKAAKAIARRLSEG